MAAKKSFDWLNLIAGVWLIISPWALGFSMAMGALWTSLILGLAVGGVAIWALARPTMRASEWVNVVLGALLFIAPWVIRFAGVTAAAWNAWIFGIIIAALAILSLISEVQMHQHVTR